MATRTQLSHRNKYTIFDRFSCSTPRPDRGYPIRCMALCLCHPIWSDFHSWTHFVFKYKRHRYRMQFALLAFSFALAQFALSDMSKFGKPCSKDAECGVANYCAPNKKCAHRFEIRDPCTKSEQCGPSLYCPTTAQAGSARACTRIGSNNATCESTSDCLDFYYCASNKRCRSIRHLNEICSVNEECAPGLTCDAAKKRCVPTKPTIQKRQLAESCSSTATCNVGLMCNVTRSGGLCSKKTWNNDCKADDQCITGYACISAKCKPLSLNGGSCNATIPCASHLFCNSANRCQLKGTADIQGAAGLTRSFLSYLNQYLNGTRGCTDPNPQKSLDCFRDHMQRMSGVKFFGSNAQKYALIYMTAHPSARVSSLK